ncbi:hypothetical protein VTO73DRAFT_2655 [Trametes versicolor]
MCQSPDQHLAQGSSIISSRLQARTRRHEMPMGAIMPPLMCIPLFSLLMLSAMVPQSPDVFGDREKRSLLALPLLAGKGDTSTHVSSVTEQR